MNKIEKAKQLLKELNKTNEKGSITKARRMFELQEALIETQRKIKI